jgi:AcrR family transcriptional regulator
VPETASRPVRADARRNYDRLLEVAVHAFATDGAYVALEGIAKTAGVGIGTLYRHFPTREALVEAVYRHELTDLCDAVPGLLQSLPPDEATRAWMDRFIDYLTTKHYMAEALRAVIASGGYPFAESRGRLTPRRRRRRRNPTARHRTQRRARGNQRRVPGRRRAKPARASRSHPRPPPRRAACPCHGPSPIASAVRAADQPSPSYLHKLVLMRHSSACMITQRQHQANCATAAAVTNVFEGDTEVVLGTFGTPVPRVRHGRGHGGAQVTFPGSRRILSHSKTTSIYGFGCRRGLLRPLPLHPGVASGLIDKTGGSSVL